MDDDVLRTTGDKVVKKIMNQEYWSSLKIKQSFFHFTVPTEHLGVCEKADSDTVVLGPTLS